MAVATWNEPTATDNSGQVTRVSRTHQSGNLFPEGTTTVMYEYTDPSNNIGRCSFDVIVSIGKYQQIQNFHSSVHVGTGYSHSSHLMMIRWVDPEPKPR